MKKQQWIVIGSGIILVAILFLFGKTVPQKKQEPAPSAVTSHTEQQFDFESSLSEAKSKLSPDRQAYVNRLENSVVRGDVKNQQMHTYHQLASFWKDSANRFEPYAFYTAEASKLENSEKSLTFAAQLFLDNLRGATDPGLKNWMATQSRELFERALKLNPANDSAKIGIGSTYIFSSAADDPQQVMTGIQKILEVSKRDSTNMYAQLMLGIGGLVSGQLDRSIERLTKVVAAQPTNVEAILTLAEAYERKGDNANAVKWYEASRRFIPNPAVLKEIDDRIKDLK